MLQERIQDDMKTAMKARDAARVSVLRMALADLKNVKIEKGRELTDDDVVQALKRGVKQREESAEQYRAGNRLELAEKEEAEIAVLKTYLPERMSGTDLAKAVQAAVEATGAASIKDMGKVMKAVMAEHGARVDGKEVQEAVKKALGA
jgi:hypothetical protein